MQRHPVKGGDSQPPTTCFLCGSVERALPGESTELTAGLRIAGTCLEGAADCSGAAARCPRGGAERQHTGPNK